MAEQWFGGSAEAGPFGRGAVERAFPVIALLLGLVAMYLPTSWRAAHSLWISDDQAHGPLILLVCAWSAWNSRRSPAMPSVSAGTRAASSFTAWLVLLAGAALYCVGRNEQVWALEIGSAIPVVIGSTWLLFGWEQVRRMRFAIGFLVFAIPLPQPIVDEITAPLKREVSMGAEQLLYLMGYPVARDGVVISIGQYRLLVADACSGLYSMASLLALAVFYTFFIRIAGFWRNATLLAASLPIAYAANVTRVVALGLITFHLGDRAGRGFLHGAAGILMFVVAIGLMLALDGLMAAYSGPSTTGKAMSGAPPTPEKSRHP